MTFLLVKCTRRLSTASCPVAEEREQFKEVALAPSHEKAGKSSTLTLMRRFYTFAVGDDRDEKAHVEGCEAASEGTGESAAQMEEWDEQRHEKEVHVERCPEPSLFLKPTLSTTAIDSVGFGLR